MMQVAGLSLRCVIGPRLGRARIAADLVGSLVAGLGFRVAPERLDLRVLLPLCQARNQQPSGHPEGDRWYMPAQHQGQPGRDSPANEPHRHRQVAESSGSDAERYDRARPSYPAALAERIAAASPGSGVLDASCGTGIATRQFPAAGCRVLGVDPDQRMAGLARQSGLGAEVATFEDWDPAGRAFDAVIAGQAWHWVDPVAGALRQQWP
jgi:Methyltransferase domain